MQHLQTLSAEEFTITPVLAETINAGVAGLPE